ncbi:Flagellar basal-body rod protein FlgG (Distal rod protein) [Durusdinium trenchii]|uniref:Flagellar basal-body rod protein FlgG n=1 Tax=Durusdinium trenchii TaxID=1381693 RepID=A0ABP0PIY3_9DINO
MPYGLYLSAEGAEAQSFRMEVITNNLANVNTPGFKRDLAVFQARYAEANIQGLDQPGSGSINDIGGGIEVRETETDYTMGPLKNTGAPTDFAVKGEGFFVIDRDGEQMLTRSGNFMLTNEGDLVTQQGYPVLDPTGNAIVIDPGQGPWQLTSDGSIAQAGTRRPLALVKPTSLDQLAKAGENLFRPLSEPQPLEEKSRHVISGFLEQSGVSATLETMQLIEASRAFEANVSMIRHQDEMLNGLVNRALETKLDVIANNLANSNTTAFKKDRANFEDLFYRDIALPGLPDVSQQLTPTGIAVGLGSRVQSTQTNFEQGAFQATDRELDIAVEGHGFLQVADPAGGPTQYTRAGNLSINADGNLVIGSASTGRLLEPPIAIPQDATRIAISSAGIVAVQQADQTDLAQVGTIQLSRFINPEGLLKLGENLYAETEASGQALIGDPQQQGYGAIRQGWLEASNVEPVQELIDLITTQRAFELNSQAVQGALVLLGDVAEILTNDPVEAERLASIELFPAPASSRKRFVSLYEMRDALQRKLDLSGISLSGASRITVHGVMLEEEPEPEPERAPVVRPVSSVVKKRAELRVEEALTDYLRQQARSEGPWTIRFSMSESQMQSNAEALAKADTTVTVMGGRAPWTGSQSFSISVESTTIEGETELQQFSIDTVVTLPPAVVVAARPLTRGSLIREGDVRLDFQSDLRKGDATFDRIEDVIGLETTQSIAAGDAMLGRELRKPLLVKAGDAVTVYARTGGIQVRTVARARDSGSMGELVSVETLNDRKAYFARVSGIQKVEVYARAVSAEGAMPAEPKTIGPEVEELSAKFRAQLERAKERQQLATNAKQPRAVEPASFEAASEPQMQVRQSATEGSPTILHPVTVVDPAQSSSIYAMPDARTGLTLEDLSLTTIAITPPQEIQKYDTITIIVDEKSQMLSEGEMQRRKRANLTAILEDWIEFEGGWSIRAAKQRLGDQIIGGNLNSQFRTQSELETRDGLKFRIAATEVDIRPNGHLVLEAHKTIKNNDEFWEQRLTGIVNPEDILPNRSVLSEKITNLNIAKCEEGHVRDGYRRGWLLEIFDRQEENTLQGWGLVVGLNGTGDGGSFLPTIRPLAQMLQLMGNQLGDAGPLELKNANNVALVLVTATVPAAGGRQGDQIDCQVMSIGAAKSLAGGRLFMTPLTGPIAGSTQVFATTQGWLEIEDSSNPTTAVVHRGCRLEADFFNNFIKDNKITLVLEQNHANFQLASEVAELINTQLPIHSNSGFMARALDPVNIEVTIPEGYRADPVLFVSLVQQLPLLEIQSEARVVINERNGSIVIDGDVEIGPVVVTHKNVIVEALGITPSDRFFAVNPNQEETTKLQSLIEALGAIQVPNEDVIDIIKNIERSGRLHAKLIIE